MSSNIFNSGGLTSTQDSELLKIDSAPMDGLLGTPDSLCYEVGELVAHFHGAERWAGAAFETGGYIIAGATSVGWNDPYFGYVEYNSKTAYMQKFVTTTGLLWWDDVDTWIISDELGVAGTDYYSLTNATPVGTFTNQGAATGTVTGTAMDAEDHRFDISSMNAFVLTAGNDTWGPWTQLSGTYDTPVQEIGVQFDPHRIFVSDVHNDGNKKITRFQFGYGPDSNNIIQSELYTEYILTPERDGKNTPENLMTTRVPASVKGWGRVWVKGIDSPTVDIFLALHEYVG